MNVFLEKCRCLFIILLFFLLPLSGKGQEYTKNQIDSLFDYKIEALKMNDNYRDALALNLKLIKQAERLSHHMGVARGYLNMGDILYESGYPKEDVYMHLLKLMNINDNVSDVNESRTIHKAGKAENCGTFRWIYGFTGGTVVLSLMAISFVIRQKRKERKESMKLIAEIENLMREKEKERRKLETRLNVAFEEVVSLAKENAPSFLARFQEVYPHVYEKLLMKNPKLVNTELTLCAMIWLNFSSKEISRYTYVQPKTVQIKKYRLRKKLNIPEGKDIYKWIKNL